MGIEVCVIINVTSHWDFAYIGVSVLEVRDSIREGDRLPNSADVTKDMKKLITSCWSPNPKHRPDFKKIMENLNSLEASLDTSITNQLQPNKLDRPFLTSDRRRPSICGVKVKRKISIGILFLVAILSIAVFAIVYTLVSGQLKSTDPSQISSAITTSMSATVTALMLTITSAPIPTTNTALLMAVNTSSLLAVTTNSISPTTSALMSTTISAPILTETTTLLLTENTTPALAETSTSLLAEITTTTTALISTATTFSLLAETTSSLLSETSTNLFSTTSTASMSSIAPIQSSLLPIIKTLILDTVELNGVTGLVIDKDDIIYVLLTTSNKIMKFSAGLGTKLIDYIRS